MTSAEVAAALGVPRAHVADELNRASLERIKVAGETAYIDPDALEALVAGIERELLAFHDADPKATGITTAALRDRVDKRLSAAAFDALLGVAVERNLATAEKGQVRHPKAAVSALAEESAARDSLTTVVARQGLTPGTVSELAAEAGVDAGLAQRVLGKLATEGHVVRVTSDLYFAPDAIDTARSTIERVLGERPDGATAAELRDALGVSRKHAIPLLEYFDARGVTKRQGDVRVLR